MTDVAIGELDGILAVPPRPRGVVVFAHGSGSGRRSPRNQAVGRALFDAGLGTLLIDLLTPAEEAHDRVTGRLRFDIPLLARRVVDAIDWLGAEALVGDVPDELGELPIGCFGASTGAAAALIAAAQRPHRVGAVVSRGGRPDLAGEALARVHAPTLLIVGGADPKVLELNRWARTRLGGESRLEVIPGASHRFAEPGVLERVAALTRDWFRTHLAGDAPATATTTQRRHADGTEGQ